MDWAQLSRILPEDGDRIQYPKRCVLNKKTGSLDNVQKLNNFINIPSLKILNGKRLQGSRHSLMRLTIPPFAWRY
jgi:hypothetical protein